MEGHDDEQEHTRQLYHQTAQLLTRLIEHATDDDARHEWTLQLAQRVLPSCPTCQRRGYCSVCAGDGRTWQRDAGGSVECTVCCGSGDCAACAGVGLVPPDETW